MRLSGFPKGFESAVALIEGECAVAVCRDGEVVHSSSGRGIAPLIALYDAQPALLSGAAVADKVIGKAAAMILVKAGTSAAYGAVMSETGRDYLLSRGVTTGCGCLVARIANRSGDGLCPIEQSVLDEFDPDAGLEKIRARIAELQRAMGS